MSIIKIPFLLAAAYSLHICYRAPNPPAAKKERIIKEGPIEMQVITRSAQYVFWLSATIEIATIIATYLSSHGLLQHVPDVLLPHRGSIQLTPIFVFATILMIFGTWIRAECFRAMGNNFTFEVTIRKDHSLVTSGPYSIVRHPSYSGGIMAYTGFLLWQFGHGSWLRSSTLLDSTLGWGLVFLCVAPPTFPIISVSWRVSSEDRALRSRFGAEWDRWAKRVPSLLFPGVL